MDTNEFCDAVEDLVKKNSGIDDGGDLCYNLIEMGEIWVADGVDAAARIVQQRIQQA